MAISSTSRKAGPFTGNGTTTEFSFDFKVFDPTDVAVVRACPLGAEVTLALGSAYDIALNEDQNEAPGGVVTLREPLGDGCRLVLLSVVPDLQPVDITNQGGFYPELLNDGLDRSTIQVQQVQERLSRAITVPVTADVADLSLPTPAAGQIIGWADGRLVNYGTDELVSVVTYGATRVDKFNGNGSQTSFGLSASPGSQNNLRISIDGVVQVPGDDFTWAGGTTLAFVAAPPADTRIVVQYQEALADITGAVEAGAAAGASAGTAAAEAVVGGKANVGADNLSTAFVDALPYRLSAAAKVRATGDKLDGFVQLTDYFSTGMAWADVFEDAFVDINDLNIAGELLVPDGNLTLLETVVVPIGRCRIRGKDRGATVIRADFQGDVFRFKAPSGSYLQSGLRDLSIQKVGAAATDGYAVVFDDVGEGEAHNVSYIGTYRGFGFLNNNRNCRVFNCGGSEVVAEDFVILGGGNQHIRLGTTYDSSPSTTTTSVLVRDTERLDLDHFTSSLHGMAVEINPLAGKTVQNVLLSMPDLDASKLSGLTINPAEATGVTRNVIVTGGLIGASSARGIEVLDGPGVVGEIVLSGGTIRDSGLEGAYFRKGRITMTGVVVGRNGTIDGASGIRLGAGVETFSASGVVSGAVRGGPDKTERPMPVENFQLYGLDIDSGFAGTIDWSGGSLAGNLTGPVRNNSSVVPNITGAGGYATVARGTATIAIGSGFVTITPPTLAKAVDSADTYVHLTCLSNPDLSGVETVWVGAATPTTFDICASPFLNVSGQDLRVGWEVRVR